MRAGCLALVTTLVLAGCSGAEQGSGRAELWITRDRGANVILTTRVAAGQTALQALDREADVETRYGGRFVESIEGIESSAGNRRDWFWFVNGYEGDRSAAEYRLHPGDVLWWDYRSWGDRMREKIVVGAFPEPFLHGWAGKRRRAVVLYLRRRDRAAARRLARIVRGRAVFSARLRLGRPIRGPFNVLALWPARDRSFTADQRQDDGPGDPVVFRFFGDPMELARDPALARFRYRVERGT